MDNVTQDSEYLRRIQGSMKQRIDEISRYLDGDVLSLQELFEYAQELIWSGWQFNYWLMEPRDDWKGL